jgi:hypothetical protein
LQCRVNRPPHGSFLISPDKGRGFSPDEVAAHPTIQGSPATGASIKEFGTNSRFHGFESPIHQE